MKKLFKLKKWLTVPDAARYLSIAFGEEVQIADVLRFSLDGHLTLSVNFVNHAKAKCGEVVGMENTKWGEISAELMEGMPNLPAEAKGKPVPYMLSLNIDGKRFLNLDEKVLTIHGVYDLPMIGNEKMDVEHEYQKLTGGPDVTLGTLEGVFVEEAGGRICQLQERFADHVKPLIAAGDLEKAPRKRKSTGYYPAGALPVDHVLVVRVEALRSFEEKVVATIETSPDKEPGPRSERTYQNIIGGLLDLLLGMTPARKPQSVFKDQAAIISALMARHPGTPGFSSRTLEEKFAQAKRSLISD